MVQSSASQKAYSGRKEYYMIIAVFCMLGISLLGLAGGYFLPELQLFEAYSLVAFIFIGVIILLQIICIFVVKETKRRRSITKISQILWYCLLITLISLHINVSLNVVLTENLFLVVLLLLQALIMMTDPRR